MTGAFTSSRVAYNVNKYQEAHVGFLAIYLGENVLSNISLSLSSDLNYLKNVILDYLYSRLKELEEWINAGGEISEDAVIDKFNSSEEEYYGILSRAKEYVEENFGEDRRRRVSLLVEEFERTRVGDALKIFEDNRREAIRALEEAREKVRELCEKAGIDGNRVLERI